jgi:hypothetical protein
VGPTGVAVLVLGACGFGPVEIPAYDPEPGTSQACTALSGALPDVVSDAVRRDTEPASPHVAAWGDPAVVLRCGVPLPGDYSPDAQLLVVDGVGWLPVDGAGGTFFTTTDRVAHVEVAVPDDYAPEADVLADLAPAILDAVPELDR